MHEGGIDEPVFQSAKAGTAKRESNFGFNWEGLVMSRQGAAPDFAGRSTVKFDSISRLGRSPGILIYVCANQLKFASFSHENLKKWLHKN